MTRLFMLMLTLAMTTLAGIGVIVVLAMGFYDVKSIVLSAIAGAVIAVPVAWVVARKLQDNMG